MKNTNHYINRVGGHNDNESVTSTSRKAEFWRKWIRFSDN